MRDGSTPFSTTPHTAAPPSARTALATCSRGVASARATSTTPSARWATTDASAGARRFRRRERGPDGEDDLVEQAAQRLERGAEALAGEERGGLPRNLPGRN